MKCITILLLAATTSIASAQNFQMTSSVNTPYNAYDSSVYDTTLYHYAVGQSKPDTATTLHWSTSNHHWANYSRHYASYTSTKKPAIEARQDWNNTTQQWNDIYRDSFAYNSLDSLINHSRLFAVQGGGWTNGPRFVYTYDINNDLVTNLGQGWSNNTWVNAARISYTYNSQHQSLTEHHEWSNNNVQWFEALKYDISYSANTIVRVCSVFNTPGNNYFVYDRETYAFSGNDTTSILFEKPQNGSWVNSQQKQFIYNTGKITNTTLQAWKRYYLRQ